MNDFYKRSLPLLGEKGIQTLKESHVAIFGLGGVGGHAAEALCRSGVGKLTLVDSECFELSNCNRQIFATSKTVGQKKTQSATERLLEINPQCQIRTFDLFYSAENDDVTIFSGVDYILDAIDTVSSKILLINRAKELNIPVISCMGTGNKLDPTAFRVADLFQTKVCPLARVMRAECKKRGIHSLKVVYSEEEPKNTVFETSPGRHAPGSVSFVPGVAGMILAGEIIKDLCQICS